jgi:hypothetical protein
MKRRNFIAGLAAAPLISVPTAAPTETPVSKAYRECRAFRDWLDNDTRGMDEAEFDAMLDRRHQMELALFDLPNTDLRDAALKLMAYSDCGNDLSEDGLGTARRLFMELGELAGGAAWDGKDA